MGLAGERDHANSWCFQISDRRFPVRDYAGRVGMVSEARARADAGSAQLAAGLADGILG
jgi:hypothetical protein